MSSSSCISKIDTIRLGVLVLFVALITSFVSPAYAHGGADSNLDVPMAVAPPTADLTYSADAERSSATGRLRHLGEGPLKAEEYFRLDVPTQDLVLTESSAGIGRDFSFILPRLAKGYYALDWSVTPLGDHSDGSIILFQITVGGYLKKVLQYVYVYVLLSALFVAAIASIYVLYKGVRLLRKFSKGR